MTRLTDDLRALSDRHGNLPDDVAVPLPLGAIRAAVVMLERYEAWPLVDRINEIPVVPQVGRAWQRKGYRTHA